MFQLRRSWDIFKSGPNQTVTLGYPDGSMGADWFRNQTWDETIERGFNEKLRRARKKDQYLRIQALTLACSHPEIALRLLDQYFSLKENFFHAQAYVDPATALLTLGRLDEAIGSYEAALAREIEFPNLKTPAYLDLPYLIATRNIRVRFAQAIQLLETVPLLPRPLLGPILRRLSSLSLRLGDI